MQNLHQLKLWNIKINTIPNSAIKASKKIWWGKETRAWGKMRKIKRLSVAFPERYKKYQRGGSGHGKRGKRRVSARTKIKMRIFPELKNEQIVKIFVDKLSTISNQQAITQHFSANFFYPVSVWCGLLEDFVFGYVLQ